MRAARVAWVSVDRRDNDPTVLLTYIAAALDRVERLEPSVFRSLASRGAGIVEVARLTSVVGRMDAPVLLVLDHAEEVTSPASLDMIAELSMRLPEGSQLAIGSAGTYRSPSPVSHAARRGRDRDRSARDGPTGGTARSWPAPVWWGSRILRSITSSAEPRAGRRVSTWRRWR